jgi:DNA-binding transcriptional ArsR family regulator
MNKTDLYDAMARTGKALASGRRLEMLELLAQGERSVHELATVGGLNMTTASAHLQVLRDAGLVASRREGTKVFYRLSGDDVAALVSQMFAVAEGHRPDVRSAKAAYLPDDVRVMTREEVTAAAGSGEVVLLDVRPSEEFAAGHLPGAVSIPLPELAARLEEIPADVEVVAYCRGRYCVMSYEAVHLLNNRGRSAALLADGILEWRSDESGTGTGHQVAAQ